MTVRLFPEFDSVSRHSSGRLYQSRIVFALILCFLGLDFFPFSAAQAGEVELEHGTIIRGSLVPILGLTDALASKLEGDVPIQESARTFDGAPIYLVDDGMVLNGARI